ncbi:hypothetical protein BKI52_24935 [marine bacterium AO1-C]|nr:hypothetical protein BKI52_24935 [marine bacterium AO1-C]
MTYYETLGVSPKATLEEITKAYQTLTKKFQEFGESSSSDKFIQLNKAYEILSNDNTRKTYDIHIDDPNNEKKVGERVKKTRKKSGTYDNRNVISILILLSIILGIFLSFAFASSYFLLLPVITALIGIISLWRSGKVAKDKVSRKSIIRGIIDLLD